MSLSLDALTAQVTASTDIQKSAVILLQGLSQALKDAAADPVAVNALAESLKTSSDALAEAIVANTPATPGTPFTRGTR